MVYVVYVAAVYVAAVYVAAVYVAAGSRPRIRRRKIAADVRRRRITARRSPPADHGPRIDHSTRRGSVVATSVLSSVWLVASRLGSRGRYLEPSRLSIRTDPFGQAVSHGKFYGTSCVDSTQTLSQIL